MNNGVLLKIVKEKVIFGLILQKSFEIIEELGQNFEEEYEEKLREIK